MRKTSWLEIIISFGIITPLIVVLFLLMTKGAKRHEHPKWKPAGESIYHLID